MKVECTPYKQDQKAKENASANTIWNEGIFQMLIFNNQNIPCEKKPTIPVCSIYTLIQIQLQNS